MPYGFGHLPQGSYGPGWQEQMNQYPHQPGTYHQQPTPNPPPYRHPAAQQQHAQFSALEAYNQGQQQQVYYQTPSYQQPQYRSPPTPQTGFPPADDPYSPDPLSYYQPPPQGYHQNQQLCHLQPSASQHQLQRPEASGHSVSRRPSQPQWPSSSRAPSQPNLASPMASSAQLPLQGQQQQQRQQQQQQQRASTQPRPIQSHPQKQVPQPQSQPHRQHSQPMPASSHPQPQAKLQMPAVVNPRDLQRKVAHVEVPVARMPHRSEESAMAPAAKRRRSNEGHSIPVCNESTRPLSSQHLKQSQVNSSPLTDLASSQIHALSASASNVDYQAALLSLSDEYITAAYSMSASLSAVEVDEDTLDHYHALLSTGMGCLESVLNNYRIPDAREEARIRLRLASLLFEETDNDLEAEEVLSKGISSCERFRLVDPKYAMHHLLARIWYDGGKTKAAMKAVDKLIIETEKLGLMHWVYAFRFLRVSFGLQSDDPHIETASMVKHLNAISETAAGPQYNVAVQIVASAFTALVHLRSPSPDSLDLAQRALATARAHQLGPEMASMPQVKALLDFLDLACSLVNLHAEQAAAKLRAMQANLDAATRDPLWAQTGHEWFLPLAQLKSPSSDLEKDTQGIFKAMSGGSPGLSFKWLTKNQVYTLGYLLSGLSNMHKNATLEHSAESFLSEGVKLSNAASKSTLQSVTIASKQYQHQRATRLVLLCYVVFAMCGRSEWETATKGVANIRRDLQHLERQPDEKTLTLVTYLDAICKHGLGDLDGALHLYHCPELALTPAEQTKTGSAAVSQLKVIATLNAVLIMRNSALNDEKVKKLLTQVEPFCVAHTNSNGNEYGNKAIKAAFNLIGCTATSPRDGEGTILKTKQYMQTAMQAARSSYDDHLLCMLVNIMTDLFFTNVVGEQAEKSAKAGRNLAKKTNDRLWTAVSDRMYADTLDRSGKTSDAGLIRNEAWETMHSLPPSLKAAFVDVKMENVMV